MKIVYILKGSVKTNWFYFNF